MTPSHLLSAVTLLGLGAALAAGERPAATITLADHSTIEATVESETIDKLVYLLGTAGAGGTVTVELAHGKYLGVAWKPAEDVSFQTAVLFQDKGELAKAAAGYRAAIASAKWFWEVEDSHLRLAECLSRLGRGEEALAALADFAARYPASARRADLVRLRAQVRLDQGDAAGADADFAALVANAGAWQGPALLQGM